jgi:hypothetical protein
MRGAAMRGHRKKQVHTRHTSLRFIMTSSDAFAAGVADVRAGRGFRKSYEHPEPKIGVVRGISGLLAARDATNWQWNYERGRQWAIIAGLDVRLFDEHGPTEEALKIARRANNGIL